MKKDIFPVVIVGCLAAIPVILIMEMHHPKAPGIDQTCMSGCTTRGFSTDYCQTRCSLDASVQEQSGGNPADPRCMNRCLTAGREHDYCAKTCRYY